MELTFKPARAGTIIIILVVALIAAAKPGISTSTKAIAATNPRCPLCEIVG